MAKIETESGGAVEVYPENDGSKVAISMTVRGEKVALTWLEACVLIGMLRYCVDMLKPQDEGDQ